MMKGPTILLVEDDLDLLHLLTAQLSHAGFEVATASDGTCALMLAQKRHPSAVILDLGLPGTDGFVIIRRLKSLARLATTPVIVVTGRHLSPEQEETIAAQAFALLHKPVDVMELERQVRAAVAGSLEAGAESKDGGLSKAVTRPGPPLH